MEIQWRRVARVRYDAPFFFIVNLAICGAAFWNECDELVQSGALEGDGIEFIIDHVLSPRGSSKDRSRRRRGREWISVETSCGAAAAATWIFCGDELRRRRGCDVDIPWKRIAATRNVG